MIIISYNNKISTSWTINMSTPNPNQQPFTPSKQHLLNLIISKDYKSYKLYINELQRQNSSAQTAIVQVLSQIFINKKYRVPSTFFNALVLYKQLVVSAIFDFLCEDALFPQKIHRQIGQICRYRGKEKDLQLRGSDYFKAMLQIQPSEQASTYGYNYILLALQLIKSMAKIYPSNYLDPSEKSIFKDIYDKLIAEEVFFPKEEQFAFIKEKDRVLFSNNYQKFKRYVQAMLEQEDKEKKKKGGKEKQEIKDDNNILQFEQLPLMSKIVSKKKQQHSPLFEPYQSNTLNVPTPQFNSQSSEESSKITTSKIDYHQNLKKELEPQPRMKVQPVVSTIKKEQNLSKQIDRRVQSQNISIDKKVELAKEILSLSSAKNNPALLTINKNEKSGDLSQKPKHFQSRLKISRTQNKKSPSSSKKERQNTQHNLQTSRKIIRDGSHRSLPKTQRRSVYSTPKKTNQNFKGSNQPPSNQKVWVDNDVALPQSKFVSILSQKLHQTLSQSSSKRRELNLQQTLAKYIDLTRTFDSLNIAHCTLNPNDNKYKPLKLNMIELRDQSLKLAGDEANPFYHGDLIEARLIKQGKYEYRLSLRNMSQNALIVAFKDMSCCRYSNAIRVISWGGKRFEHNTTTNLDYLATAKQKNFKSTSSKFTQFISHSLSKHSYLDIKFTFFLTDPTFKFLPFDLSINGHDFFLILPLTLLDMAIITPSITPYFLQRYTLQGMVLKTVPFTLRTKALPSFFGSFQFKEFYPKNIDYWHNSIVGGCQMQIPSESYLQTINKQIYMLVRLVSYPKRMIEMMAVYHLNDKEQEKFVKEMLQLLVFLLREGPNI